MAGVNREEFSLVISTAATTVVPPRERDDAREGAARYGAVPILTDNLLHDVRNPLNALSIHLEVLAEKLKGEAGVVPATQEKNLRAMREQIQRVDGLLRLFAEFLSQRAQGAGEASLSEGVARALEVLGHEARRRRLKLSVELEPGVVVRLAEAGDLGFLVLQPLLRAFLRAEPASALRVSVRGEGSAGVLEVSGALGADGDPALEALAEAGARQGVELQLRPGLCRLVFPRA